MDAKHVKLGEEGRLVIPAALRKSAGMKPGDTLVIESDGDSLLVRPLDAVVREVQAFFADALPADGLMSGELIRDRRAEAERESRG